MFGLCLEIAGGGERTKKLEITSVLQVKTMV